MRTFMIKLSTVTTLLFAIVAMMSACEKERSTIIHDGPAEEKAEAIGDKMDNASEDTKDKLEEAGETIDETVDDIKE